jgi:hypothetical protein
MLPAAVDAKRSRLSFERQWRILQPNRINRLYSRAYRTANKLVQQTHLDYFQQELSTDSSVNQRWSATEHLRRSANLVAYCEYSESAT